MGFGCPECMFNVDDDQLNVNIDELIKPLGYSDHKHIMKSFTIYNKSMRMDLINEYQSIKIRGVDSFKMTKTVAMDFARIFDHKFKFTRKHRGIFSD
jgi:hypothetical protein